MRREEKFICARRANRPGSQRLAMPAADNSHAAFVTGSAADGDRPRAERSPLSPNQVIVLSMPIQHSSFIIFNYGRASAATVPRPIAQSRTAARPYHADW